MKEKKFFGQVIVLGFALFAMFFGAGNLILPPALGVICGQNWFSGFLMYILADAGLSVLALLAFVKARGGFVHSVQRQLTPKSAFVLCFLNALCIGPLIAVPRTAATTFDIGVRPLLTNVEPWMSWVFGLVYFGAVALLCLRPGKVVDIIGKILSPLMLAALLLLIAIGIIHPLGEVAEAAPISVALSYGLQSGYQTMDMLGVFLLGVIALLSVQESGITDTREQMRMVGLGGIVAGLGLFIVYGGLSYLGATVSGGAAMQTLAQTDRPALLISITHHLVGDYGRLLLGLIVAAACLTTAIGLTSACAKSLEELTNGKLVYRPTMIAVIVISYLLSNFGTEMILSIAAPILNIIFPIFIMLVFLSFFPEHIRERTYAAPLSALLALIVTVVTEVDLLFPAVELHADRLPLAAYGLGWLLPALLAAFIGGVVGTFFPRRQKE